MDRVKPIFRLLERIITNRDVSNSIQERYEQIPRYSIPKGLALDIGTSLLLGKRRSIEDDARRLLGTISPASEILDQEFIPKTGSFVVVGNHYERKGLWVAWGALLVTDAIHKQRPDLAGSFHWLATSEWPLVRLQDKVISNPFYSWAFQQAARTYGLILLSADSGKKGRRASAILQVLSHLQLRLSAESPTAIGVFPEGRTGTGLIKPPYGAGSFLTLLNRIGVPILPVGLAETNGTLSARFGEPFHLQRPKGQNKQGNDEAASLEVMVRIGVLLPEELWGEYRSTIHQQVNEPP